MSTRRKPNIIIASGNELAVKSALAATQALPIVMIALDYDPLALGYMPVPLEIALVPAD